MEAVFFAFSLVGVLAVMHWAATNDKAGNRGVTKGLFAMRDFAAEAAEEKTHPSESQFRKRR
jgi:hypothetical protein